MPEADATRALQALHREYQLDKRRPLADTTGRASKLTLLGFGQIGRALAEQLVAQQKHLRRRHLLQPRNSQRMCERWQMTSS